MLAFRPCVWLLATLTVAAIVPLASAQAPPEIDARQVRDAIDRGVAYLKKQQSRASGGWTEYTGQTGGLSALCTLALLSSGEKPGDPAVAAALKYLESLPKPETTYAAALQIMVFSAADPKRYKERIASLALWIEAHQIIDGDTKGSWTYSSRTGRGDNSNTQFALLGLHEAERAGVPIKDQTWQLALNYWLSPGMQKPDGAFAYEKGHAETGSMTCAGIASLVMCLERLNYGDASLLEGRLQCCGEQPKGEEVERALDWLGRKFSVTMHPTATGGSAQWLLYYLYGVERVGRITGRRYLGDHDWYREGAAHLVNMQDHLTGSWVGKGLTENNPLIGTSLALLFLAKGRRPVLLSKVKYEGEPGSRDWDLHRRAVHNLTARVEKQWQRDLSWQTIDLARRDPRGQPLVKLEDLLDAPVLFLSGTQPLRLSDREKALLKNYLEQGGFLFAEACDGPGCSGADFDRSFRLLMQELFPDSPLRRLPPDHAVWYAQEKVNPAHLPRDSEFWLWGLDTCCRTSVVYAPRSLSCYWEVAHPYREPKAPQALRDEIEAVLRLGTNVVAYATNRDLKEKLDRPNISLASASGRPLRGALAVPKLAHGGGSDDAPNALANLLTVVEQQLAVRVHHGKDLLAPSSPKLLDHPLVFMHGRRAFRWNPAERQALKEYLARGGFVMADAICASPEFAESVRAELKAMFPEGQWSRVPAGHPLVTDEFQGFDLSSVTLRDPQLRVQDDPLTARLVKTQPVLEAFEVSGRIAVVLSPYDLSCALEKGASLECKGYIPPDAARIGANILLYALQQ